MTTEVNWGPTGEIVYNRTYSRVKPDGSSETWPETVERVVDGNLALVDARYQQPGEREELIRLITEFKMLPAGRHLWASGVKNAQHLFNCWVSGWTEKPSDHFEFTFMRLMEAAVSVRTTRTGSSTTALCRRSSTSTSCATKSIPTTRR